MQLYLCESCVAEPNWQRVLAQTIMRRNPNSYFLFVAVFAILSCKQVQKKYSSIEKVSKQDSFPVINHFATDTFQTSIISKDIIINRTFTLRADENFYSAMDSQRVMVGTGGQFYFLHPSSGKRVSLPGLNRFYEGGGDDALTVVTNNSGKQKFLFGMYHPVYCDINGRGIKQCKTLPEDQHEFIISDVNNVFLTEVHSCCMILQSTSTV